MKIDPPESADVELLLKGLTKTLAFENSNKTLVVTYEFANESQQTAFKNAVDTAYGNGTMWANNKLIKHTKTEWLHQDGSVSSTASNVASF